MTTTYWAPNQSAIAQVRSYSFTAPSSVGNTYSATINGKTVTYTSESGDTAALVATGLYSLLRTSTIPELQEITFANPESGVVTATARTAGTPFAGVTVNGVANQGLVLSTGNGLANGITTTEEQANRSPSDINDAQNWLRTDFTTTPPNQTRSLPQSGDDVVVSNTSVPMLWNLDQLAAVRFATYERHQSFTGTIGLPERNPGGYSEWRATYFKFDGPAGSVPAGGLEMTLGLGAGAGPTRERYDLQSSKYTLTLLAAGSPQDTFGVRVLGQHTDSTITIISGSVGVAMLPGEKAQLSSSSVAAGGVLGVGPEVTWKAASTLTLNGGAAVLNTAPATVTMSNAAQLAVTTTDLTWAAITAQGGCRIAFLAGGIITTLTLSQGCVLDKSRDARGLTITNSTVDGDNCQVLDPLNAITWTNATAVKQAVTQGPFTFTGQRTVKVT